MRLFLAASILLSLPAMASAQGRAGQFELTPYYGYQFAGSFSSEDPYYGRLDYTVDEGDAWGLTFGIPVGRSFQVELLYFRHDTDLEIDEGFLNPGIPVGELRLDFYHAGVLWQSAHGQIRPYASMTGGVARIDTETRGSSDTRLSFSFGGGVKVLFNDHVGVRLDGRLFVTDLGSSTRYYDCCGSSSGSLAQGQLAGGLILAF